MNRLVGKSTYSLVERMYPITRSLSGDGVRKTYDLLDEYISPSGYKIDRTEIPSGTKAYDWTIPKEWRIRDAYIEDESGRHIIDFKESNLRVVGYSRPVDEWVSLEELKKFVHTEESQPDVIPYVTSYYEERFGFCMSQNELDSLNDGRYHMFIESELFEGSMTTGEVVIPGNSDREVFFSTYTCHPSMCNDNCSGPALASSLINYVADLPRRFYTYRFIFIPETIGAISYISRNLQHMKGHIDAGFNICCVGDNNDYSIIHSIDGDTYADRVLLNVLHSRDSFTEYPFIKRASDERQYNSPGVDLPVVGFCRSKYGEFPEYHTSADNLSYVSPEGFAGSYDVMTRCIEVMEEDALGKIRASLICEAQLGKRGLYPTISHKGTYDDVQVFLDILAYANGCRDLIEISDKIGVPIHEMIPSMKILIDNNLLERIPN